MQNKLQTVILAGGYGTRLHPLTERLPKPLVKIFSRSVLEMALDKAKSVNPSLITVTSMFMPDTLEKSVSDKGYEKIDFVREDTPLGTAGAVKNAYDGESKEILVLSGDGVFDFDLERVLYFHRENEALVTIATTRSDEVCEFGVVISDNDGRVTSFHEKPSWGHVTSSQINTGIYVLDSKVLNYIPKNASFDFSKQLFPHLLRQKERVFACPAPKNSYWCDIGSFDELFECTSLAMQNKIAGIVNDGYTRTELEQMGIEAEEPLYVHRSVTFGKNIKLGRNTCLCENVSVSDGCTLSDAIVYEGCSIGKGSGVYGCIVGRNTFVGENCIVPEGCVLGGENTLCDGVILKKNTRLKTGRKITEGNNMAAISRFKNAMFCDRGVICGSGDISPEYFSRLGCVLSEVIRKEQGYSANVGVMTDGGKYSSVVAELLRAGLRSGGACVYELSEGNEALACFAAMTVVGGIVAYVNTVSENTVIKLIDADGRPLSRQTEQKIEKVFREDKEFEKPQTICASHNFSSVETLYFSTLMNSVRDIGAKGALTGFECSLVKNDGEASIARDILERALMQFGAKVYQEEKRDVLCLYLSPDGTNLYVKQNKTDADLFHVGAVLLNNYTQSHDGGIMLHEGAPEIYSGIAQSRKIRIYENTPLRNDMYGRFVPGHAVNSMWLYDGVFAAVRLCFVMKMRECTLSELLSEIPDFAVFTDELVGVSGRAEAMESLSKLDKKDKSSRSDGIRLVLADGTVTVIPGRVAGFKIISEAHSFEAAKELCHKVEDVMRGK